MRITRTYDRFDIYTAVWKRITREYEGQEAELILMAEERRAMMNTVPASKPSEDIYDDNVVDHEHQLQRISGEKC